MGLTWLQEKGALGVNWPFDRRRKRQNALFMKVPLKQVNCNCRETHMNSDCSA